MIMLGSWPDASCNEQGRAEVRTQWDKLASFTDCSA